MSAKYRGFVLIAFVFTICSLSANASVISFNGLSTAGSGSTNEGNSVTLSGFTFTDLLNGVGNGFAVWQASSPNLPSLNTANTSLFEFFANSTTQLTQSGNTAYTLNSIDLAQYNNLQTAGTYTVSFIGTHADNTTVSQSFTVTRVTGTPVLQTFTFSNFTNVVKVDFTQGVAASGTAYQFDNVVVNTTAVTPEPGSFLLGAASLVGLWASRRRTLR
jgi:MYXO-CTERM domain-containing protein